MSESRNKMKRGMLFIYNVYFYTRKSNYRNRTNSEKDVEALTKTFRGMNAVVEDLSDDTIDHIRQTNPIRVRNDEQSDLHRLQKKIEERITNGDFTKFDYVAFAILSHGSEDDKIELYDGSCNLEKTFLEPLNKNDSLRNKLKWIITCSCRGKKVDLCNFSGATKLPFQNYRYYIVSFPTKKGYKAFRSEDGNIFIQALCSTLEKKKYEKDLETILEDVKNNVNGTEILKKENIAQRTCHENNFDDYLKFYFFETEELFSMKAQ